MIPHLSERALILAPRGRDAEVAAAMLAEAGMMSMPCRSIDEMTAQIGKGAGYAIVTEEALRSADLHALSGWILAQPEWSDFPFILLTVRGGGLERNPAAARYLETLGNVTFLERPFHPTTLISLAQSARRARKRQYEARARLDELHTLAADLELRVERRTAERQIALEHLHEAQKLETLGQLTGGVAHDFNNLLTPIIGALDLLQRKLAGTDPRSERMVANALLSGERAKTLVQRLLGFARRQELQRGPVHIADLIEGMRDLVESSIGPTIELEVLAADPVPSAVADANQLELAILNVCVNARDAMPGGGRLTITVEAVQLNAESEPKLPPGLYVHISITDTGTGMDAATLARAVEPFFSTKEMGRGTGLGLSMVHGLAAQLGGAIVLSSTVGQGTTAGLYLPSTEAVPDEAIRKTPSDKVVQSRQMNILVVDDERLVRKGTAEMLRGLGHSVIEAEGGAEALIVLGSTPGIDAIVTDYKMPRMDGVDLANRVRADRPEMPILLISGYTGAADPVSSFPRLSKPFGLVALSEALEQI